MPSILMSILFLPLIGVLILFLIPSSKKQLIKGVGLIVSLLNFILSLFLWIEFDCTTSNFQFLESFQPTFGPNIDFSIGLDGISLFFVILTTFLVPVCLLVGWVSVQNYIKEYFIAFLLLESLMLGVFCILDLLLFYVFFESVLIPMFLIIGVWGSRERKIRAAYQFFLYTLIGSVLMLLAILFIYFQATTI